MRYLLCLSLLAVVGCSNHSWRSNVNDYKESKLVAPVATQKHGIEVSSKYDIPEVKNSNTKCSEFPPV